MTRRRNLNIVRTCHFCHRTGTHAFTKNGLGQTICQHAAACMKRAKIAGWR